jgi:hypothetical protein
MNLSICQFRRIMMGLKSYTDALSIKVYSTMPQKSLTGAIPHKSIFLGTRDRTVPVENLEKTPDISGPVGPFQSRKIATPC